MVSFEKNLEAEIANLILLVFIGISFSNSWTVSTDRNNFKAYGLAER